ncbi:MAG: methionine--tRNA ligase [bacterium]|nr:methionine--tRNA ligase [bacterium]
MNKFYVTTSIPYVNGAPHIGNVLDSVYADVLARYHRQLGDDVRFLTGTDEHGSKIVRSAKAAGLTPQEFVDKNSFQFKKLKDVLNLSWDDFIRTSDQSRHWSGAQKLWGKLEKAGDLYKKAYKGLYCIGHEAFITDKDLVNGICQDHQKAPEVIEEENYFFKLSKYTKEIEKQINLGTFKVVPESRRNEILSLLSQGLEDVSFSRPAKDLSWGVPVPGDSTQTMYVWADALVNYISALGYGSSDEKIFEKYWPADVQVIGKDNLRFHAAIWPGMLLSAGLPLPQTIFVHGFLNVNGQKISKTVGNVIDPAELVAKYGTDPVRFYLLREVAPFDDGDFSYEKFEEVYNANLANGLGNFSARVLALGEKAGELAGDVNDPKVKEILAKSAEVRAAVAGKVSDFKFHEALAAIWGFISYGDVYVNNEKPWEAGKEKVITHALLILEQVADLLKPFLPETAKKILDCIEVTGIGTLKAKKCPPLFPRIEHA